MKLGLFAFAASLGALAAPALADTTVKILHVDNNPAAIALFDKIAKDYEADHKDVKVQFQYLENEAFKAKLPTMLQSDDSRPSLFYSWGGGVMVAQSQAGFLKNITADVAEVESHLQPTAVDAFKVDGKVVGVPWDTGEVTFFYNKQLFNKAGVKAEDIKTWDDFLAAVKKIKAAGIVPLDVGAGEKWPMHFYYAYLVMRIGGEHALTDAKAGKDGGFKGPTWVKAGEMLRDLAKLEPFQPGYLSTSHADSAKIFGDGKAAIDLMGEWLLGMQGPSSTSGKGLPASDIGLLAFPVVQGGKGNATDTLGGVHAWLVTKTASPEAVDFLKFFNQEKYAKEAAETAAYIPVYKDTAQYIKDPLVRQIAEDVGKSAWHQNFFDQDLGPSVGRVINDASVSVAAGEMTPQAGAAAIQDAFDQQ